MDSALPKSQGLYDPANEHDACGVGFVAHMKGVKSHSIVEQGLLILKNINHRGAVGADPLQGDGAGILIQIPDQLYRDDMIQQGVMLAEQQTLEQRGILIEIDIILPVIGKPHILDHLAGSVLDLPLHRLSLFYRKIIEKRLRIASAGQLILDFRRCTEIRASDAGQQIAG